MLTSWILRLQKVVHEVQPDVIMGWMYHGNLAASLSRYFGFEGPILWNVRHSVQDLALEKRATRWTIRIGSWCGRSPERIVYNSSKAAEQHEHLGFPAEKRVVIPNGFNLVRFRPDPLLRLARRRELGIPGDVPLLGMLGRVHPMKNHLGWLQAFAQVRQRYGPVHCIIAGTDVEEPNGLVARAVREAGLENAVTLLGSTQAPEHLYPSLDLLVMPSLWGESFPNVVGEAMGCGVPALVTDVGDAPVLVGDTGFLAANGSPEELAQSTLEALELGIEGLASYGRRSRKRMENCYELEMVGRRYKEILQTSASFKQ
jgi:glycosyltransferase involved in cell wall biosynthesis